MVSKADEFLHGQDARWFLDKEDDFGRLIASDGWRELAEIGRKMADIRTQMLLSPAVRPQGPSDDFLKGAIYGIQLLLATPPTIMQQAQELHAQRAEEIE